MEQHSRAGDQASGPAYWVERPLDIWPETEVDEHRSSRGNNVVSGAEGTAPTRVKGHLDGVEAEVGVDLVVVEAMEARGARVSRRAVGTRARGLVGRADGDTRTVQRLCSDDDEYKRLSLML